MVSLYLLLQCHPLHQQSRTEKAMAAVGGVSCLHVKVGPTVPIVRVDASTNTAAAWQFCSWAPDGSRGSWFWTRASFVLYRAFMLCVVLLLWLLPRRARQVSRGQRQPPPAPLDNEFLGSFRALTRVRSTGRKPWPRLVARCCTAEKRS